MKPATLRVALYRFRATFGRQWGGYLALAVFIALVGGLAMGVGIFAMHFIALKGWHIQGSFERNAYGMSLTLVLGLEGKLGEAETLLRRDLPPELADADLAYLQAASSKTVATPAPAAPQRSWDSLKGAGG